MHESHKPYSAAHVANFFLDKAFEEGVGVDNLKLQKLVYIGYGWGLAVLNRKLFSEHIEAWQHGPVIPSLYHEFKHNRWRSIRDYALEIQWDIDGEDEPSFIEPRISADDPDARTLLEMVWDVYKNFSGWDLRDKTHEKGTPWSETFANGARGKSIPDQLIKRHFLERIKKYLDVADDETAAVA